MRCTRRSNAANIKCACEGPTCMSWEFHPNLKNWSKRHTEGHAVVRSAEESGEILI